MKTLSTAVLALLAIVNGCSTHDVHTVPIDSIQGTSLSFLAVGATSREEAIRRLGDPTGTFLGGEILTFTLAPRGKRGLVPVRRPQSSRNAPFRGWEDAEFNLVLVFDTNERVREFCLVKVR